MLNRTGEMEVFVRAVEAGSFSAAARALGLTPSAVSKLVDRLESRLGVQLVKRSTRRLDLTPEGRSYLERSTAILADIEETEREVSEGGAAPRGLLRVNASIPFGTHQVVPLVPEFLARFPGITLDLSLTDAVIDLIEERADVAIRVGALRDSSLKARRLGESRRLVVASPAYLARAGTPREPADIARHACIAFNFRPALNEWPFRVGGATVAVPVPRTVLANNGETVRDFALAGLGLARLGAFHVARDVEAGTLVPVLEEFDAGDAEQVHAIFMGHRRMPARVRVFLDFLAERIRLDRA